MKKKTEELDINEEELTPMRHEGHRLLTRRDFMAQGFLGSMAFALAPSALSLLTRSSFANELVNPLIANPTPVIIIELAGGGNIAGSNVMVGGAGGQSDFLMGPGNTAYNSLGLHPDIHPSLSGQISDELGLKFHSDSGILRGIQSIASTSTRQKVEGAIFCTTTSDDTANGQLNSMYWLNKAGRTGTLNQIGGLARSKSPAESVNLTLAPVKITSRIDALNLVKLGDLSQNVNSDPALIEKILNTSNDFSLKKLASIKEKSLPMLIREKVENSYRSTNTQVQNFTEAMVDPDLDGNATTVFNMITNVTNRNKLKPITKLVLDGLVGVGTMVLGGYDYHNGTRSLGELRDLEAGQVIGAIFELASRKAKDVVVIVITDGGVSANSTIDNSTGGRGKFCWQGDSGQRGATLMMVYQHAQKPSIRVADKRQIGFYKTNGAIDTNSSNPLNLCSNSVINMNKAIVANYLALHDKVGALESVVGSHPFGNLLDNYLIFNKLGS